MSHILVLAALWAAATATGGQEAGRVGSAGAPQTQRTVVVALVRLARGLCHDLGCGNEAGRAHAPDRVPTGPYRQGMKGR